MADPVTDTGWHQDKSYDLQVFFLEGVYFHVHDSSLVQSER